MTLGEGKEKVYMLLDEHSAGGVIEHDPDIEAKLNFFFDIAQKEVAKVRRLRRTRRVSLRPGETELRLPADWTGLCRVWAGDRPLRGVRVRGDRLLLPARAAGEELVLEYFAVPETITPDTPDDWEFELREDACGCLPYYVAAQQLLPDLVMDYSAMLAMYRQSLSLLPPEDAGEGGGVAQRLFRRGG